MKEDFEDWQKNWGGEMYYCENTKHSMGQIILLKKGFSYKHKCIVNSKRILAIEITVQEKALYIFNIYGPNDSQEKPNFFHDLKNEIRKLPQKDLILLGDANTVLNNDLDIISGENHSARDIEQFKSLLAQESLTDLWRLTHDDRKEFTWIRNRIARRLDYILVHDSILEKCIDCEIKSIAQSDHRLVKMKYRLTTIPRGPSYYKFNDSLLHDRVFVDEMNTLITNFDTDFKDIDPQCKWDICKIKIKEFSMAYSKEKCRQQRKDLAELNKKLNEVDEKISQEPQNENLQRLRQTIKQKLEIDEMRKAKSAQIRSREKFIAEGEKNTKYFLNLEKVRGSNRIIESLKTETGTVTSQKEIIKEQVSFFKKGFKNNTQFDQNKAEQFITGTDIPQLTQYQKEQTDAGLDELPETEILAALKQLRNSSAPGLSGITTSFVKFFLSRLKGMLVNSIRAAYTQGEMSVSQKKAVITLIYKEKGLPRDELKNYRPISLLEIDYKILAKCLALRLSKVIASIVNEDQVGFIKGRKASTIIRLIDDITDYIENENKPGVLLALDYSRAFDSISKDFIIWSFRKFGFGEKFIKWVEVLTKNTESCINYNGWISNTFSVETGIRQGCPFSPMAFVLALEILAIKIRNDDSVKGIKLPKISDDINEVAQIIKLLLYADDITMFCHDRTDLQNVITIVNKFSEFSQLKMSTTKTEAMWLGSSKNNREKPFNLIWTNQVKILGIIFKNNTPASNIQENWQKRINKIQQIITQWSKRNLSISGKLCIIKSFLISQMVYPLQALNAPQHILNTVNTLLFRFLWKKKNTNTKAFEKVKRVVMCDTISGGGLGMINIMDMQTSFLLNWIAQLQIAGNEKWKVLPKYHLNKMGTKLACLKASIESKHLQGIGQISSTFWTQCLRAWTDNKNLFRDDSENDNEVIWNNKHIAYRQKSLFIKKWVQKIGWVNDVWQNGNFLTIENIIAKIGYYPAIQFDFNAVKSAVSAYINNRNRPLAVVHNPLKSIKTAQQFRKLLTENKRTTPTGAHFWRYRLNFNLNENNWLIAPRCTKEERLRLTQWKILHNIYPTKILLHKMGKKDNELCDSCGEVDYIEHFFWRCYKIQQFWSYVSNVMFKISGQQVRLSEQTVLFGIDVGNFKSDVNRKLNHVILIAKMTISKFRYGDGFDINCMFDNEIAIRMKLH